MFNPKKFDGTPNTVSFNAETFRKGSRSSRRFENQHVYTVDAIWVSAKGNTHGALVSGSVDFIFNGEQYADLTFSDLLALGRKEKNPNGRWGDEYFRDVRYDAAVLVGLGNVWAGVRDNVERKLHTLLEMYFDLPKNPAGYTEWLTQSNRG